MLRPAASRCARSRRCRRSTPASPPSTSCPTPVSARSSQRISQWPTIPQLFVRGELVGGCDIVTEMFETGELAELLGVEDAAAAAEPAAGDGAPLQIENRLS